MNDKIEQIKNHFEEEAAQFDNLIIKLIPHYRRMIDVMISMLPFSIDESVDIVDLGCGTGSVAKAVQQVIPTARLTCVDLAQNMLDIARTKLKPDTSFINCDFYDFEFDKPYEAVLSSLALHHLVTDDDKLGFYKKIYNGLKPGGIFINADVLCISYELYQQKYIEKWKQFMQKSISIDEINNVWLKKYEQEDCPASLTTHFALLKQAGFSTMDAAYKYYNYAVYYAVK